MSPLFGTDGVRGVANSELTPELAFRIGRAAATVLHDGVDRERPIIVGRDTRVSGSMLEAAIVAGITSAGSDALLIGVVPTPAVACVTRCTGAAAGVVISASHNPVADNGIKFFAGDGFKLSDDVERRDRGGNGLTGPSATGGNRSGCSPAGAEPGAPLLPRALRRRAGSARTARLSSMPGLARPTRSLPTCCANSGANVVELNCENDGSRINVECGATDLRQLQAAVRSSNSSGNGRAVGVAFDGDADRALFVDETGEDRQRRPRTVRDWVRDARAPRAGGRYDRRNGDEQHRLRARAAKPRHRPDPNRRRRPLRARTNAGRRIYVRRRAIGSSDRFSLQHDRRWSKNCRYAVGHPRDHADAVERTRRRGSGCASGPRQRSQQRRRRLSVATGPRCNRCCARQISARRGGC